MLFGVTHSECVLVALKERVDFRLDKIDWRAGEILDGMLKGAWHRWGDGGLQERHVHREASLWLFIYGLAALQWRPYHHNEHRVEDKTREHIQNTAQHTMSSCVEDRHFPFFYFFSPHQPKHCFTSFPWPVDLSLHYKVSAITVGKLRGFYCKTPQ